MLIVGIDHGKKASAVVMEDTNLLTYTFWNSKHKGVDGQREAVYHVQQLLSKYQPDVVGIETAIRSVNTGTAILQGIGVGMLYQAAANYHPHLIHPSKLHKLTGDKSSIAWALKQGYELPNVKWKADTLSDSIAIAIITLSIIRGKNE